MVSRLTVSLPDELHAKLKTYKINPSKLFQSAARELVEKEDSLQKAREKAREDTLPRGETMDAFIEKMRKEKAVLAMHTTDEGYKEGMNFAKSYGYETLRDTVKMAEGIIGFYKEHSYLGFKLLESGTLLGHDNADIDNYFSEPVFDLESEDTEPYAFKESSEKWLLAWCDGVIDLWTSLPEDLRS